MPRPAARGARIWVDRAGVGDERSARHVGAAGTGAQAGVDAVAGAGGAAGGADESPPPRARGGARGDLLRAGRDARLADRGVDHARAPRPSWRGASSAEPQRRIPPGTMGPW